MRRGWLAFALLAIPATAGVRAGEADVMKVEAVPEGNDRWRFNVTVAHADEGGDHYADKWEVLAPDGRVLGVRELLHPHEAEQPFTRSLSGVVIPPDLEEVVVRAHDSRHGYGGREMRIPVER